MHQRPPRCHLQWTRNISTTFKGTAFEKRSLLLLETHLCMTLRRTGGKSDRGIDLQGWWWLPQSHSNFQYPKSRIRVFAQCKAEKKRLGPKYIREMEGAVSRYLPWIKSPPLQPPPNEADEWSEVESDKVSPLVAMVISESPFTKEALLCVHSSPIPFLLTHIPPILGDAEKGLHLDRNGINRTPSPDLVSDHQTGYPFGGVYCNQALVGRSGILGGQMDVRWVRSLDGSGRPSLWFHGDSAKLHS
ncbi:hypothetical protein BDN72DRAFT_770577 [Pluteus cervinus]|uniref:Uncharacterized protein n=1 Tax=Pluteus cervinus TaxID=181527 RepID=A0ACD3APF2_9AGAR|nr:hypothetical protein BDN72DRAFT_770577 [Pluteus cervinus]